jgi:hypothetical protein
MFAGARTAQMLSKSNRSYHCTSASHMKIMFIIYFSSVYVGGSFPQCPPRSRLLPAEISCRRVWARLELIRLSKSSRLEQNKLNRCGSNFLK